MTNPAPDLILSDFERIFEELPEPTDEVSERVREAIEQSSAGDRPVQPTRFPKGRAS